MGSKFKSAVSVSEKWDAREAGNEVVADILSKLGEAPDVVLLFSTIHYRKYKQGGMQALVDAVYNNLPKGTLLVGGTVAGFVIPQGCYTMGVTAMAIKADNMDFSVALGEDIKRNPKGATLKCTRKIKNDLSKSRYSHKFLLSLPSGITTPKIPGFPENLRVIRSNILSKFLIKALHMSLWLMQKGPVREDVIIGTLAKELPEYKMIGGSLIDDNKGYFNYQFYNGKVYENAIVTLGISSEDDLTVNSTFGLKKTNKKFKITKTSFYDLIIEKINNKPALGELLRVMEWSPDLVNDSATILKRTFYNPIGYDINGKRYISVMAFIFGDRIMVSPKVQSENACIMTTSGKKLISSVSTNLAKTKGKNIKFGLITACIARLETLGAKVFEVHKILKDHFGDAPFLQIYAVGEDVYTRELGAKRIAESFNTAVFYEK